LLNVIRGDMSLVGVRPDTPSQEVDYSPSYWQERHRYRPGITGPAQIHSSDINLAIRTKLEQEWLSRPTVASYFGTLFATLNKVLKGNSF
jgi:lipopolysaccharide/colanic/teichoic acid biosynthesis glycosyltransferase